MNAMRNEQVSYTMDEARTETGYRLYHNYDWESQEDARRAFDGYTRQCNDNAMFTSDEIDIICTNLNDAAKQENE
jgi:hypothetical protein